MLGKSPKNKGKAGINRLPYDLSKAKEQMTRLTFLQYLFYQTTILKKIKKQKRTSQHATIADYIVNSRNQY